MPVIKQYLIVCPPTPGPRRDEWAERGSEPGKKRAELQLPTWGKGHSKAPFSTYQFRSNVSVKLSPAFLSFLGVPTTCTNIYHLF